MIYRKLGKTQIEISAIVLGCWAMGKGYFGDPVEQNSIHCIRESIEHGITTIDNAELYGRGEAEEVLGKAIAGLDREKLVLISKAWTSHFGRDSMEEACNGTLKRLGTDYLDVYFLHYPPVHESMEEAVGNMMRLKEQGKIRAIGVSNFSLAQLREAMQYGEIDVIQPCYNLLWRYDDRDVLPFCIEQDIGVITYSSLAQGLLTDKYFDGTRPTDGRAKAALFQPDVFERCLTVSKFVAGIAQKYGKTTAQTAINWMVQTPGITAPIVGGTTVKQALENIGAVDFTLSAEDYAAIDAVSREFVAGLPEYELFFNTNIKE